MTASLLRHRIRAEVAAITAALAARRDPATSGACGAPCHRNSRFTRRASPTYARRPRSGAGAPSRPGPDVLELCDALWATGWREERIVAISLVAGSKAVIQAVDWEQIERWSGDIDNWEHVDHLADVTCRLLIADRSLLDRVKALESSENPWQRRLALVTLIVAFMKGDVCRDEALGDGGRLKNDKHPLVRRAVVWARDRLEKDHLDG